MLPGVSVALQKWGHDTIFKGSWRLQVDIFPEGVPL